MLNFKLFAVLAIVLASGIFYGGDAFAAAGTEFSTPTQTNAYASYNNGTNQVQVSWNFNTLPSDTTCFLKGDVRYNGDLNIVNGGEEYIPSFTPRFYSPITSNPVLIEAVNDLGENQYVEEVSCSGETRIDIDTIMNHVLNVNNYQELQLFLTFYVPDSNGDFNTSGPNTNLRIDEVFVMYTPVQAWNTGAQDYGCGGQIGSTLYIDASGSNDSLIAHGNNGDNCTEYQYVENNEWVEISMEPNDGNITKGFHNEVFPLLIEIIHPTVVAEKKGGGCGGDCTPPTFYKNKNGLKIVSEGFEFNGNATDVTDFHTPYDLITINTNQTYNLKLKVYENNYLEWLQIGFGIDGIGDPLNEAESLTTIYLNFDKTLDRVLTVEKHTLVDIPRVNVTMVNCGHTEQECYLLDIDFIYRDQQKNNVIGIEAVDRDRNNAIHYINDGILIVGESMNAPLEQQTSASKGGAFYPQRDGTVTLTLVDYKNDLWQDEHGYMWSTTHYGPYMIDAVPKPIKDADPPSQVMTRTHSNFPDIIISEQQRAVIHFDASKIVSVLDETFAYEFNIQSQEDYQNEMSIKKAIEADRASKLIKNYSLDPSLYLKNAYNHWDYYGDMSLDEIKSLELQQKQKLDSEWYQQILKEYQKYNPANNSDQRLAEKEQKRFQLEEEMRYINENY